MAWRLVSLLAILAVCDAGVAKFDPRVVNGEDAKPGEFPHIVSLQTPGYSFHFCGGSILNADYVLTAAHCLEGKSPSSVQVAAGTVNLNNPHSVHGVEKIILHADYDSSNSWINDIALIKVSTPFVESQQISFVALPEKNEVANANDVALLAGWGRLWQWGPATQQLQKAHIYIADQDECRKVYRKVAGKIYDTSVCANDPSVEKGACNGDSGGPLSVNGKLAGIVSWSMGCALTDYPTVYTRVTSYLDWIAANAV